MYLPLELKLAPPLWYSCVAKAPAVRCRGVLQKKYIMSLSFKKVKTLEMSCLTHTQHHAEPINQEGEQLLGFSWKMSEIKVT
jgi:hypothetical protein